jgi:ribosomal protein S18 acetylase RimI-like enzyme
MQCLEGDAVALAAVLEMVEADVWADWLAAAPPALRERLRLSAVRTGGATAGITASCDLLHFNRVVGLGVAEPVTELQLDALLDAYDAAGAQRWMIQWSPAAQPYTTPELLRARGFFHHSNWIKLVRDVAVPLPPLSSVPCLPPAAVHLVVTRAGARDRVACAGILAAAFGWPYDVASWTAQLLDRPNWRVYLAYEKDTPIATALFHVHGDVAWLGFGATRPEYMHRGAQCALIAERVRAAAELGCTRVVVETTEDRPDRPSPAFHNVRRLGFTVAYVRPNFVMARAASASSGRSWPG